MFEGSGLIELAPLGEGLTRLTLTCEVRHRTLPARMLLQSLKLAQGRVQQRFDSRVSAAAAEIAARWQVCRT
jgi:hypothetical protein